MITLIVPTYNRAYALEQVLPTFYQQSQVSEIIFIDDASVDHTKEVIEIFSKEYPSVKTNYLKNSKNMGASYGRWVGVENSINEYILFCDDDEFLEINYASVCLAKYKTGAASIISGRHLYRLPGEKLENAIKRFGNGTEKGTVFGKIRFKIYTDVVFENDIFVPFTHGIFFTTKTLITQLKIDSFYSRGNGFREESDFQVRAFLEGHKILITNDTHCVHMNMSEVKTGGQRVSRIRRFYWTIFYTHYFLKKYYRGFQKKLSLPYPLPVAMLLYFFAESYSFFIRPFMILPGRIAKARL